MKQFFTDNKRLVIILCCILAAAIAAGIVGYLVSEKRKSARKAPEPDITEPLTDEGATEPSFEDALKKYASVKSLSMSTSTRNIVYMDGKVAGDTTVEQSFYFKRPDKMLLKGPDQVLYCDGKKVTAYVTRAKTFTVADYKDNYYPALAEGSPGVNTIGLLSGYDYSLRLVKADYEGDEKVGDYDCHVFLLKIRPEPLKEAVIDQKVWIDKATGVMVRNHYKYAVPGDDQKTELESDSVTSALSVNKDLEDSLFVFIPKKDDKLFDAAAEAKKMAEELKKLEKAQKEAEAKNPLNKKVADFPLRYYVEETVYTTAPPKPEDKDALPALPSLLGDQDKDNPMSLDRSALKSLDPGEGAEESPAEAPSEPAADTAPAPDNEPVAPSPVLQNVAHSTTFYSVSAAKNTVVAFWAYPDSKKFLPMFDAVYKAGKDKYNFVTICLNIAQEEEKALEEFMAEGWEFPIYFMDQDDINKVIDKWVVQGIPTVYLIDDKSVMKQCLFGDDKLTDKTLPEALKAQFK
ncbi:MAG: DUF2092 domain-containing protein [Abditibacteriota bacterium]|nr:DUF2092 domain-containing protein [Abditibacteriota bacterium]